jgi:hypothetical protein
MKEKTELLMELPEQADEAVEKLEGPLRQEVESGLDDFSRRAGQAMASGSVFFMYALLYPEDYREGDENDLENYIESLRARA